MNLLDSGQQKTQETDDLQSISSGSTVAFHFSEASQKLNIQEICSDEILPNFDGNEYTVYIDAAEHVQTKDVSLLSRAY